MFKQLLAFLSLFVQELGKVAHTGQTDKQTSTTRNAAA